jgi:hypothetical protein
MLLVLHNVLHFIKHSISKHLIQHIYCTRKFLRIPILKQQLRTVLLVGIENPNI